MPNAVAEFQQVKAEIRSFNVIRARLRGLLAYREQIVADGLDSYEVDLDIERLNEQLGAF